MVYTVAGKLPQCANSLLFTTIMSTSPYKGLEWKVRPPFTRQPVCCSIPAVLLLTPTSVLPRRCSTVPSVTILRDNCSIFENGPNFRTLRPLQNGTIFPTGYFCSSSCSMAAMFAQAGLQWVGSCWAGREHPPHQRTFRCQGRTTTTPNTPTTPTTMEPFSGTQDLVRRVSNAAADPK